MEDTAMLHDPTLQGCVVMVYVWYVNASLMKANIKEKQHRVTHQRAVTSSTQQQGKSHKKGVRTPRRPPVARKTANIRSNTATRTQQHFLGPIEPFFIRTGQVAFSALKWCI